MAGLESLIAEYSGSVSIRLGLAHPPTGRWAGWWGDCLLERDAVLGDMFEARLPDESHVAGVGGLESP